MKEKRPSNNPPLEGITGAPRDSWDMVNKYGTYEVQDITENLFPTIGPETDMKIPHPTPDSNTAAVSKEKKNS